MHRLDVHLRLVTVLTLWCVVDRMRVDDISLLATHWNLLFDDWTLSGIYLVQTWVLVCW